MSKWKTFWSSKLGVQVYSFIKTYFTVFIGTYLGLIGLVNELDLAQIEGLNLADVSLIALSAKAALIAVVRNIYKLLTEK